MTQHADHAADVVERAFGGVARCGDRLLRRLGITIDKAFRGGGLNAHRRKGMRRDVVNLARDAHALLLDAPGGLFLACALRLRGTALGLAHIRLMRAEAVACRRRRRDQSQILHLHEKRQRGRDRRSGKQEESQHRQHRGNHRFAKRAFGREGEQRHQKARRGQRHTRVHVLQREVRDQHEHRDRPGKHAPYRQRKCSERERDELGDDVHEPQVLAQRQIGDDDRRDRQHQLDAGGSKGDKRHDDVDRPILGAHATAAFEEVFHTPMVYDARRGMPYRR